jgi:hypothetical protein
MAGLTLEPDQERQLAQRTLDRQKQLFDIAHAAILLASPSARCATRRPAHKQAAATCRQPTPSSAPPAPDPM